MGVVRVAARVSVLGGYILGNQWDYVKCQPGIGGTSTPNGVAEALNDDVEHFKVLDNHLVSLENARFFSSLAFPSALTLGTEGDLPGIVTWRAFTTPGTGAPITGPP